MEKFGEFISYSVIDTENWAKQVAKTLKSGTVVALFGDLGAGKTAFTRGLAAALECPEDVSSPTFSIVNNYGKTNLENHPSLIHFDMYRVNNIDDLEVSGYYDYIDAGDVLVIEWSENIVDELPDDAFKIYIKHSFENDTEQRIIKWEKN